MDTIASIRDRPTWISGRPRKSRTYSPWGIAEATAPSAIQLDFGFDIIEDGAGHYHLCFYSMDRTYQADTWHETLADAFAAAEDDLGIRREEWGPPQDD